MTTFKKIMIAVILTVFSVNVNAQTADGWKFKSRKLVTDN